MRFNSQHERATSILFLRFGQTMHGVALNQTNKRKKNRNKYEEVEILSAQYMTGQGQQQLMFSSKQTQLLKNRLSGILGHDGVDHLHFIHHS